MKQKMLVEEKIISVTLCIMVVMVAAQVASRYVLHTSLSYTEEIVRYLFVWTTFLGAGAAGFRGKHLSVTGVLSILPPAVQTWIRIFTGAAAMVLGGVLFVFGSGVVMLQFRTGQSTAALGVPMWIIGLAVPVCSAALIFRIIASWRKR